MRERPVYTSMVYKLCIKMKGSPRTTNWQSTEQQALLISLVPRNGPFWKEAAEDKHILPSMTLTNWPDYWPGGGFHPLPAHAPIAGLTDVVGAEATARRKAVIHRPDLTQLNKKCETTGGPRGIAKTAYRGPETQGTSPGQGIAVTKVDPGRTGTGVEHSILITPLQPLPRAEADRWISLKRKKDSCEPSDLPTTKRIEGTNSVPSTSSV